MLKRQLLYNIRMNGELQIPDYIVRNVAINVMKHYKKSQSVIWIYIARNGDDYVLSNWILRGQWIDSSLFEKNHPVTLANYEEGYDWDYNKSYMIMEDFNNQYIFDDDESLVIKSQKIWKNFLPIYENLKKIFYEKKWKNFLIDVKKHKAKIRQLYMETGELGHSHKKDFDEFLQEIMNCICLFDNFTFEITEDTISEKEKYYQTGKRFKDIAEMIEKISQCGILS